MGGHHSYYCSNMAVCGGAGKRDTTSDALTSRSGEGVVNATSLCFAILAVKMCMKKRFDKRPESPGDMGLKSIWFEGSEGIKEQTSLPDKFDKTKETDIIIHGYLVDTSLPEIRDLASMLKQKGNNVLLIDWGKGAGVNYRQSSSNVQTVGAYVYMILVKNKIPWDKVHLIGQGLGAHAAAEAGKLAKGKVNRITGYGMKKPCGHLDVYVNGGRRQPGCTYNPKNPVRIHALKRATFDKACGHLKAVAYFVESARDNCKLRACECTWKKFLASKCSRDKCVYWGYDTKEDSAGTYYGVTATAFPYCRTDGSE
uniref:Lipase domain-containing protein n=1 Tax=Magallana gigas TaxID=29159 RepID=A0A8W8J5G1_MAGGI